MNKQTRQTPQNGRKPNGILNLQNGADEVPLGQLLAGIAALPQLLESARQQELLLERVLQELRALQSKVHSDDNWMDMTAARAYLGGMSESTFDKYLYNRSPKIKGYKTDGKLLFKREDLDLWLRLYEARSKGEA